MFKMFPLLSVAVMPFPTLREEKYSTESDSHFFHVLPLKKIIIITKVSIQSWGKWPMVWVDTLLLFILLVNYLTGKHCRTCADWLKFF